MSAAAHTWTSTLRTLCHTYVRRYHRHRVHIDAPVPLAPALIVANHGFGGIVDLNVLALFAALDTAGVSRPVTPLVHQLAWTAGVGPLVEAAGGRPASRQSAGEAAAAGRHVVVFPGGDIDAAKSWRDRNVVRFGGRSGFATLAMDLGLPIVPVVTAGAGESLLVLTDGQTLARSLRLPALLRIKALPINVALPWGLNAGVAGMLPYAPIPTQLTTAILPSMRARAGETATAFATRVEDAMQQRLDLLVADRI